MIFRRSRLVGYGRTVFLEGNLLKDDFEISFYVNSHWILYLISLWFLSCFQSLAFVPCCRLDSLQDNIYYHVSWLKCIKAGLPKKQTFEVGIKKSWRWIPYEPLIWFHVALQGEVWYWHWLHGTLERDALGPEPKQYMLVVGPWCILPPVEVVLGMSLSWRLPLRIPRTDVLLSARRFSMAPNTASQDANLGTELVLLVATLMLLGYSRYWHMA